MKTKVGCSPGPRGSPWTRSFFNKPTRASAADQGVRPTNVFKGALPRSCGSNDIHTLPRGRGSVWVRVARDPQTFVAARNPAVALVRLICSAHQYKLAHWLR